MTCCKLKRGLQDGNLLGLAGGNLSVGIQRYTQFKGFVLNGHQLVSSRH